MIAFGGNDGKVRRWDAQSEGPRDEPLIVHDGWVRSVAIGKSLESQRSFRVATMGRFVAGTRSGVDRGVIRMRWRDIRKNLISVIHARNLVLMRKLLILLISLILRRKTLVFWWVSSVLQVMGQHRGDVTSVALGEIAGEAVIVSGGLDGTVRLWDAQSGALEASRSPATAVPCAA